MLETLEITRFKSIRELSLDFGQVNIFIGGNGSGKSNVLEAIGVAAACLGRGPGSSELRAKGLRITPPELMKSSFKNERLPRTLELSAELTPSIRYKVGLHGSEIDPHLSFFSESLARGGEVLFNRGPNGARVVGESFRREISKHRGMWDQLRFSREFPHDVEASLSEFSNYVIYTPQTDFLRGRKGGSVEDVLPVGLHGEGLPTAVRSIQDIRKELRAVGGNGRSSEHERKIVEECINLVLLPGWLSSFDVGHARTGIVSSDVAEQEKGVVKFKDKYMHGKRRELSAYDSSEGTLFLLFVAIILSHPKAPKIFSLDNVDNALNPRLTRRLVEQIIRVSRTANKFDTGLGARQVFLTSHNPTALDAFDLFDERQRVFVVQRDEAGRTTAERLVTNCSTREEWQIAKRGRNLSELWLQGEISGALGEEIL